MKIRGLVPAKAVDALVMLTFVLGALYVLHHLWVDPNGRYLKLNYQDHFVFEWMLTHASELFTQGESPFFSAEVNSPNGVNLMANTSVLALALPLSPITLWLGAGVTFALISTLALAGTAAAWYWVLHRHLGRSRVAAFVAGSFLGFAPAMMSQIAGHPNLAGQYLIPFIVAAVLRMRHPGHVWRHGLGLAALVVVQCFINEELLFFTAVALGLFILVYVPWRDLPGYARTLLPKLGVTLAAAGVVLAYPLYFQFAGPQAYHGLDNGVTAINLDARSYVAFGRYSIAGDLTEAARLNRNNASEENTFFGWPLMLLLAAAAIALWRNRLSRALLVTGAVFIVFSLGKSIRYNGVDHPDVRGPWHYFSKLPLFDSVVPTRLGLVVTTVIGVGLALIVDLLVIDRLGPARASAATPEAETDTETDAKAEADLAAAPPATRRDLFPAAVWGVAVLTALLPLLPTPQPASDRPPIPSLFTDGHWRTVLPVDAVVVKLPGGWNDNIELMRWSTATNLEVTLAGGYFLGPNDGHPEDRFAHFGPGERSTVTYLNEVLRQSMGVPAVTDEARTDLREDVAYWKATTLVVPVGYYNVDVLRMTIDKLVAPEVGPGQEVEGVWLWDVRPLRDTRPTGR